MTENAWSPCANMETLKLRAQFLHKIRQFFMEREIMEVETPCLSHGTVTDVHLDAFSTNFDFDLSGEVKSLYLQTSPEYAMKRLLAAGSGAIFQICKAFRHEAAGHLHNPEFTMLEWYRPGFDDHELMVELDELIQSLLNTPTALKLSYQQAFIDKLSLDPLTISTIELRKRISELSKDNWLQNEDKDTLLQWLFSCHIEPTLGQNGEDWMPCFVYDFPATQSSLAKINKKDPRVAHRFELYYKGTELANGFYELQEAGEQLTRFEKDNRIRQSQGKSKRPIDQNLIAALRSGLPDCAGVALGVDRLFMLATEQQHIKDVISFDYTRC